MFEVEADILRAMGFPVPNRVIGNRFPQSEPILRSDVGDTPPVIAVAIPTRGTIFTDTIGSVFKNCIANQNSFRFAFSFTTQPIPDSFNDLIDRTLKYNPVFIWLVEDDIVVPDGCLESLLGTAIINRADIVVADYPLDNGRSHIKFWDKKIAYAGTGCVLIHASVFARLEKPYFSTKWDYILRDNKFFDKVASPHRKWGGQDIYFFRQAIEKGMRVEIAPVRCAHLRLDKMGEHLSNTGIHKISRLKFRNEKNVKD